MGVTVRQKIKGEGNPFWIFIASSGLRKSLKVGTREEAEKLATEIRLKLGIQKAEEFLRKEMAVATIRKRINKAGITWQIDYYDPEGKRVMKCFPKKAEAETYLGNVLVAQKEETKDSMAILAECPLCHRKQAVKNRDCAGCASDLVKPKRAGKVRYWIHYREPSGKQRWEFTGMSIEGARTLMSAVITRSRVAYMERIERQAEMLKGGSSMMEQKVGLKVHDKSKIDSLILESIDVMSLDKGMSGVTSKQILQRLGCDTKADPTGNSDYGILMQRLKYLVNTGELHLTKRPNNVNTYRRSLFASLKTPKPVDRLDDEDAFVDESVLVRLVEKMIDDLAAKDKIIEHLSNQNKVLREDKERYERLSRHTRTQKIKDALVRYGEMS